MKKGKSHGEYVEKVRQDTQQYFEKLLEENRALKLGVASLENSSASLEREKTHLEEELVNQRQELQNVQQELDHLRHQMSDIEGQSRRHSEQYVLVEQQNTNLANLYVAGYSLHGTLDRNGILQAIQEIIINLVGSEELAIFKLSPDGSWLDLEASFGLDVETFSRLPANTGLIGRVVESGRIFLPSGDGEDDRLAGQENLTACLPLKVEDQVTGLIVIFRLLPQKVDGLVEVDHEILDLLASQAGIALYLASIHERFVLETMSDG
jgi:regulator of replication initiation timing